MKKILLKTSIPYSDKDWNITSFSLLKQQLADLKDAAGHPLFTIEARDRVNDKNGNDPDLVRLPDTDADQLWLFALEVGNGLTAMDIAAIEVFRQRGGGLMVTRDHQDMGACLCGLSIVGKAHHFQSTNPEQDPERRQRDDIYTQALSWPNYHSGANGDFQDITPSPPLHPLLQKPTGGVISRLPAHPHEGAVAVPEGAEAYAQVIATGTSKVTGRSFNLAVAFEHTTDESGNQLGRALAEATFHRFADYNLDPSYGCPPFVTEPPGDSMRHDPNARDDTETYFKNIALWLTG
jgi:hypothetical protein